MALTETQIRNAKPGLRPVKANRKDKKSPPLRDGNAKGKVTGDKVEASKETPKLNATEKPYKLSGLDRRRGFMSLRCGAVRMRQLRSRHHGHRLLSERSAGCRTASYFVEVTKREKQGCKTCPEQGVMAAPLPDRIIDKSLVSNEVIINTVVSKYCDHNPLYRQSVALLRDAGGIWKS